MTATTPTAGGNLAWALGGALGVALLGAAWGFAVALGEVNALLLCAAAIACMFVMLDFRVGVVLLIIAMPVQASTVFPHQMFGITGLNPLNLVVVATLFSYLAHALHRGGLAGFLPRRLFWLYLVPFAVAGILGLRHADEIPAVAFLGELVAFNNATGYARDVIIRPLFLVLFALLLGAAATRSLHPRRFLAPMMVSVWMLGLLVIGFVVSSGADLSELSSGYARSFLSPLGLHANELGRVYAVAYALLLFPMVETRDFALRLALGATIALIVVALALTFSRGAFIGFVVVNAVFLVWRRSVFTWVGGALLIALLAWKLPGAIGDRLTMGFGSDLNTISAGRVDEIWMPLMPTFWESPVFGHGLQSILWSAPLKAGQMLEVSHPHNAYLQTLLDMGVVGLVLVLAYFVHVWRRMRRLGEDASLDPVERGIYAGGAAGMLGFAVAAFGGSSLSPAAEQCYLWFAIGLMYGRLSLARPAQGSVRGR